MLTTAIWSAKESVLKAIRTGLRTDTRRLSCKVEWTGTTPTAWTPFGVTLDAPLALEFPGAWSGWWQIFEDFTLTMALREESTKASWGFER